MALVHWEPLRELQTMRDRLNQVFEDTIVRPGSTWLADMADGPAMDIYERDGMFIIDAQLPGFKPEEIEVGLNNRTLTIKAQHEQTDEVKNTAYYRRETRAGAIFRSLLLPDEVDVSTLDATMSDGVLKLQAKKQDVTPTTTIAVRPALKEAVVG